MDRQHRDILVLIEEQREKGGIRLSTLKPGTKLVVETHNSFYEFEIVDGTFVKVFGGTREDGTTRFPQPVEAVIYGSTWGGSAIMCDWIGQDMRLEFKPCVARRGLSTSPVKNVKVEDKEGNWSYSMDWK
jgi:hypothetical protein